MTEDNDKNIIDLAIKEFENNEISKSETLFFRVLLNNPNSSISMSYLGLISLKKSKLTDYTSGIDYYDKHKCYSFHFPPFNMNFNKFI